MLEFIVMLPVKMVLLPAEMSWALEQLDHPFGFSIYKAELSCKMNALAIYLLVGWSKIITGSILSCDLLEPWF